MRNTKNTYCLLLLIISIAPSLVAQSITSELPNSEPSDIVHQYMLNHPNENFVIQTDRDLYFSGTELWFSVWSLDDQTLSPYSYSGIVYVELMDKEGESVVQQILRLEKNKAAGMILLPEQLTSGSYYLRVYSNLQRNFGEHLFGTKLLQVMNPSKPPELTVSDNLSKSMVSVYPEGQRLIYGFKNKLLIKAANSNGRLAELNDGFLIRQANDTIAQLEFVVPGMGYCSFYADTSYTYHLDLPGIGVVPLEIQDMGHSIHLQEEGSQLTLSVSDSELAALEKYYLVGKTRGQVFFEQALEQDMREVTLQHSSLPAGLLEFSILNSDFEERCQRLYYHDLPQETVSADLLFKKSSFKRGETIDMEIKLPEEKKFELLSLVIRKELFIDQTLAPNLKSCVDLHPYLNDWDEIGQLIPAIAADKLAEMINIYLISKKCSRYAWQNITEDKPKKLEYLPEVYSKHMSGYAYNPVNTNRIRNEHLALFFVGREAMMINSKTDNEGGFSFDYPVQKSGGSEIVAQIFGYEEQLEVSYNWPFHQNSYEYKLDFFHFDTSRFDEYDKAYVQSLLEKMYRNKDKSAIDNDDRIIAFYGVPDSRTYLEDYVPMKNMEEVFKEIVPGEKIRFLDDEYSLQLYHRENNFILGDRPLMLFNGAPLQNIREVLALPVSRVDFVDMVRQKYILQNQEFDGIINIVAKDLNLQLKSPPNIYKTSLEVFARESRFSKAQDNSEASIPDLNPTLYWDPDLSYEGNNKQITLTAGDNPGRYQVLLRGIDIEGKILESIKYITIE